VGYNDTTNAFKAYRREVIENLRPFLSNHFNLTVELPLKAVVRLQLRDRPGLLDQPPSGRLEALAERDGQRYLFIVFYVFLEHHLSRGDYRRDGTASARPRGTWRAGRQGRKQPVPKDASPNR
jgi:dolichol-phosphate mannosyltransferase